VKKNAKVLAETLVSKGYSVVTGGTDNHLGTWRSILVGVDDLAVVAVIMGDQPLTDRNAVLWDVRPQEMTGSKLEKLFELVSYVPPPSPLFLDVRCAQRREDLPAHHVLPPLVRAGSL
jgi:hypothetical protein